MQKKIEVNQMMQYFLKDHNFRHSFNNVLC